MHALTRQADMVPLELKENHIANAVDLLAKSVPATCRSLIAYHAPRYSAYLAAALAVPSTHRTIILRGVFAGNGPVAIADWRVLPDTLFLNGIAVQVAHRDQGLGSQLLADGEEIAGRLGLHTLALDVHLGNAGAHRLYRRHGFADTTISSWQWHDQPWSGQPAPPTSRIVDWPQFRAQYEAYGFGDCSIRHVDGGIRAVRVVGSVIRSESAADVTLIARTVSVSAEQLIAYRITPEPPPAQSFARFVRMTKRLGATPTFRLNQPAAPPSVK